MPTARETLLETAHAAVRAQPWTGVRMVDVAAAAGVSRQTLYNEFGSKEGLGAALVDRLVEDFLDGATRAVCRACRAGGDAAACCAAAAHWILRTARDEPIVHAALTGCWGSRTPLPPTVGMPAAGVPGEPGQLALVLRNRAVSGLDQAAGALPLGGPQPVTAAGNGERGELERAYEVGLRVALSYVVAPEGDPEGAPDGASEGALEGVPDDGACGRVDAVVRALLESK